MQFKINTLLSLLAIPALANAACQLSNGLGPGPHAPETRGQLCKPQGVGDWTFAMRTSELVVPTFDSDYMWEGYISGKNFIIYDHACVPRGKYSIGDDCGIEYVIMENFLPYVLTVTSVNWSTGSPYFNFKYGNGRFMIGENQATCQNIGGGLRVEMGCKTGFPQDGTV
ncbi:hypothetical protein BJY04DRAFT_221923 [Aspergillus karnatakaensis]|uniref:uncharacterized protein n=1 Tax=Aspergillus karnatakaensis TaxID=1810916 RepID=UPI003CCCCEA0